MSQQEIVEVLIDIGEDFAAQVFWTDEDGTAVPVTTPARMDVRDVKGQLVLQFDSSHSTALDTKAAVSVTGSSGLIQLSAPKVITKALVAGRYAFDLWATANGAVTPFPNQLQKVLDGWVVASPSTTNMDAAVAS